MATAIDDDPAAVSATGLKQLREIHDAIGRVFAGDDVDAEKAKAALASDTALTHHLLFRQTLRGRRRSEEHTSELQSLMRTSYAVFCLKNKKAKQTQKTDAQK